LLPPIVASYGLDGSILLLTGRFRQQFGQYVGINDDYRTAVDLVLDTVLGHASTTSGWRLQGHRTAVLITVRSVVHVGARVGAAVQVDGWIVGQETEGLESKRHERVVDWIKRQRWLHGTPGNNDNHAFL